MTIQFSRAVRKKAKARVALSGPSGAGKTYSALLIAKGMAGKTAMLDTERGSGSLYSDLMEYDTLDMSPPFSPERFVEVIQAAEAAGYETLIIDSSTHEWNGSGGVLELVDMAAKASRSGNSYNAWNEGSARHKKFVDAILQANMHVIVTMRSKSAYVQDRDEKSGKTKITKVGMAPEQRDGFEYEFTVMFDMANDSNVASTSKDRTQLFKDPHVITVETGKRLRDWLESGAIPSLTDDEATKYENSITSSQNLDILRQAFEEAYKHAKRVGDEARLARFETLKNERKAALSTADLKKAGDVAETELKKLEQI